MAAAVSKIMRNQDLILVAKKCRVISRFAIPAQSCALTHVTNTIKLPSAPISGGIGG